MTLWTRDVIYKAGFESQSVACRGRHWVVVTSNVGWQAIRGSESRGSGRWRSWQTGSRTPWGGIAGHRGLTTHTDHHRTACASSVGTRPGGHGPSCIPFPWQREGDTGRTLPPGQRIQDGPAPPGRSPCVPRHQGPSREPLHQMALNASPQNTLQSLWPPHNT